MAEFEELKPGEAGHSTTPGACLAIDHNENVIRLKSGRLVLVGGPFKGCSNPKCFKHKPAELAHLQGMPDHVKEVAKMALTNAGFYK